MQLKRIGSAFDRIHRIEQNSNLEKIEQSSNSLQSQINNLVDGKFDDAALNTHIEEKLNDLETQYAPKLTEVSAQFAQTMHLVKCSDLGLTEADDGINNFNLLTQSLKNKTIILVDGFYKLNATSAFDFSHDFNMKGVAEGAGFDVVGGSELFTTTTNNLSIDMKNVRWTSSVPTTVFSMIDTDINLLSVDTKNCSFENNLSYFRYKALNTLNPQTKEYGVKVFLFKFNKVVNMERTLNWIINAPHKLIDCSYNIVNNFKWVLFSCGIDNTHSYHDEIHEATEKAYIGHNTIVNDDDCKVTAESGTPYYCVVLYEGKEVVYEHNHVEGIKSFLDTVSVYDAYLSAENVYYRYNTWKNNVLFANSTYNYCLIKAKESNAVVGYRQYKENEFIIEEDFVSKFTSDLDVSRVQLLENIAPNDYEITDNYFDVYFLDSQQDSRPEYATIRKLNFSNNTLKAVKITSNPLFDVGATTQELIINNNKISFVNDTGGYFRLLQPKDTTKVVSVIEIINNEINCESRFRLMDTVKAEEMIFKKNLLKRNSEVNSSVVFYECHFNKSVIEYEVKTKTDIGFLSQNLSDVETDITVDGNTTPHTVIDFRLPTEIVDKTYNYILEMNFFGVDMDYYVKERFKIYNNNGANAFYYVNNNGTVNDVVIGADTNTRYHTLSDDFPFRLEWRNGANPSIAFGQIPAPPDYAHAILNIKIKTIKV